MNKRRLIIMKGLPGSGKSTVARALALSKPKEYVIVSRDALRSMMGLYWVPKREKLITDVEYDSIYSGLSRGYNVIVDATNLNPDVIRKMKDIVRQMNNSQGDYEFEYDEIEVLTPLWKCIWRDIWRGIKGGRYVGYKVIKRFYKKYYNE